MKGKWVCACLIGALCLLPVRISVPFHNQDGHVDAPGREQKLNQRLTLKLAEEGVISGVPIHLGDVYIEDVVAEWGEASETRYKDGSYYADYPNRHMSIGYNRAGVFELRSFHPDIQKLSQEMVLAAFGAPAEVRQTKEQIMYIYRAGKNELAILFDQKTDRALYQAVYSREWKAKGEYDPQVQGDSAALTESARNGTNQSRKEMETFLQHNPLSLSVIGLYRKRIALTLGDGPDKTVKATIPDILEQYRVQDNFFFLSSKSCSLSSNRPKSLF